MIFSEGDEVLYRENPSASPQLGKVIETAHTIGPVYVVELVTIDGTQRVVTAESEELSAPRKRKSVIAGEKQLARKEEEK